MLITELQNKLDLTLTKIKKYIYLFFLVIIVLSFRMGDINFLDGR